METPRTNSYIIFNSVGAPEKDLIGTAVVHSIKSAYPDHHIVVVSNYPEIWLHNPDVFRVYKTGGTPYFYDDYIDGKDSIIFWQNPYNLNDVIQNKKHIIEAWCDACKVPYKKIKPRVFLTQRELEVTKNILGLENPTNPIFLIQTHSEAFPDVEYTWDRDIPSKISEEVVEQMIKNGYKVIHISAGKDPILSGAIRLNLDIRQMMCAINFSDARLFINSFSQHVASALDKKSLIFWIGQSPLTAGYPLHTNLIPDKSSPIGKFVSTWNDFYHSNSSGGTYPAFSVEDSYSSENIVKILLNI